MNIVVLVMLAEVAVIRVVMADWLICVFVCLFVRFVLFVCFLFCFVLFCFSFCCFFFVFLFFFCCFCFCLFVFFCLFVCLFCLFLFCFFFVFCFLFFALYMFGVCVCVCVHGVVYVRCMYLDALVVVNWGKLGNVEWWGVANNTIFCTKGESH